MTKSTTANAQQDQQPQDTSMPRNAQAISLILQSMGVSEVEPRVIHQLLDLSYRTSVDFIETANGYAEHCGRDTITVEDLKLAISNRVRTEFSGVPHRELIMEIAAEKNKEPLPPITEKFGLRLPPEKSCLTQPNYMVLGSKQN